MQIVHLSVNYFLCKYIFYQYYVNAHKNRSIKISSSYVVKSEIQITIYMCNYPKNCCYSVITFKNREFVEK